MTVFRSAVSSAKTLGTHTARVAVYTTGHTLPTLCNTSHTSSAWQEGALDPQRGTDRSCNAQSTAVPSAEPPQSTQPAAPVSRCWSSLWHPDGQPRSAPGSIPLNAEEIVVTYLPKTALAQHTVLAESVFGHWLPVRERKLE